MAETQSAPLNEREAPDVADALRRAFRKTAAVELGISRKRARGPRLRGKATDGAGGRERAAEKFTIAEAFFPHQEHSDETGPVAHGARTQLFDIERNIRAVSMLIFHLCEDGNEQLDGNIAIGLSKVLDACASRLSKIGERIAAAAERPRL